MNLDIFNIKKKKKQKGTAYFGGKYNFEIILGQNYPLKIPEIRFTGSIFHPNIYSDGKVCLNLESAKWSPKNGLYECKKL